MTIKNGAMDRGNAFLYPPANFPPKAVLERDAES
jgi:hypothetical protein